MGITVIYTVVVTTPVVVFVDEVEDEDFNVELIDDLEDMVT